MQKDSFFLAYDDNENINGRIAAIIDYNYIAFQDDKCGFFGFFECFDDSKTAKALFSVVKNWLKEHNINKFIGPMNPSTNDECGFLSEGFDISPSLMMTYTPKYYLRLAEESGLKKIKELYAYDMDVKEDSRIGRLERVVAAAKKKLPSLEIKTMQYMAIKFFRRLEMQHKIKNLVVGCGISGTTIANRIATELNEEVFVIDSKDHIAGNCYDYWDKNNICVHKYGAHIFHTDKNIFKYDNEDRISID